MTAAAVLRDLSVPASVILAVLNDGCGDRCDIHEDCLHLGLSAARFEGGQLVSMDVDLVLGERFLITIRRGEVEFIEQVRRVYRQDFLKFARGPGFLLYECWDHLIDGYRKAERGFENHVQRIQEQIFGDVDDAIFAWVAAVTRDLLIFRKIILTAREVLNELCTRRSPFVSETTQPYLERMVGTLDRLSVDLSVEREILAEVLNLYMGIVSHRTSRVLNRLTVVSLVFLPLTFLCGIYGMNFESIPELKWQYGYLFFWGTAVALVVLMLAYTKQQKLW